MCHGGRVGEDRLSDGGKVGGFSVSYTNRNDAMTQEGETKTCKICSMGIPTAAKKCPYCLHWQRWLSLQNPSFLVLLIFIPLTLLYGVVMETFFGRIVRECEPFQKHSQEVTIVEDKMEYGEDQCGPDVIIVVKVKNDSQVDWKDVHFQVDFFNPKGQLFDTGQQESYTYRLPAGQETAFKVSFRRQFPEKQYAKYKVAVISAVDSR